MVLFIHTKFCCISYFTVLKKNGNFIFLKIMITVALSLPSRTTALKNVVDCATFSSDLVRLLKTYANFITLELFLGDSCMERSR